MKLFTYFLGLSINPMIQDKNQRRNRQVMSPLNPIRSLLGVIPRETYSPVKNYSNDTPIDS